MRAHEGELNRLIMRAIFSFPEMNEMDPGFLYRRGNLMSSCPNGLFWGDFEVGMWYSSTFSVDRKEACSVSCPEKVRNNGVRT